MTVFDDDFSKALEEPTFMSRLRLSYETLTDDVDIKRHVSVPEGETESVLATIVRDLKRTRGYLSVSKREDGTYLYRVTGDALRAFDAVDTLSATKAEFNEARLDTILRELTDVETTLYGDADSVLATLDQDIARLQEKRSRIMTEGLSSPDVGLIASKVTNLSDLIDALPASVRALSDEVRERGSRFRASIDSGEVLISDELARMSSDMLDMISDTTGGQAYLDAMRLLTDSGSSMSDIEGRFERLEEVATDLGFDAQGSLCGKWSFIESVCDEVAANGRRNVTATTRAIKARSAEISNKSYQLMDAALRRVSNRSEHMVPWGVSSIGAAYWFDASGLGESAVSDMSETDVSGNAVDYDTIRTLAGPRTESVMRAILDGAHGVVSIAAIFNSLSVEDRRFVEWGSLSAACASAGFEETGYAVWNLVDMCGNEVAWKARDFVANLDA